MKRKVLAILLSGFLIFSLVACGSEKEEDTGKANDTPVEDTDKDEVTATEEEFDNTIKNAQTRFNEKYNIRNKSIVKSSGTGEVEILGYDKYTGKEDDSVTIGDYNYEQISIYKEKNDMFKTLCLRSCFVMKFSSDFVKSNKKINVSDTILNDVYSAFMNKDCSISDIDKAIEELSLAVDNGKNLEILEDYLNFFMHYDEVDEEHTDILNLNGVQLEISFQDSLIDNGGKYIFFEFTRE